MDAGLSGARHGLIDHDGQLGPAEFLTFQRGHHLNLAETDVNEAFSHLDVNGDGLLSAKEFTRSVIEFWSNTDPNAPVCGVSPVVAEVSLPGRPVGLGMSTDRVGVRHDGNDRWI